MAIRLRIDGRVVAENLTGLMVEVDPSGNVSIDVQHYRPEYWEAHEEKARRDVEEYQEAKDRSMSASTSS